MEVEAIAWLQARDQKPADPDVRWCRTRKPEGIDVFGTRVRHFDTAAVGLDDRRLVECDIAEVGDIGRSDLPESGDSRKVAELRRSRDRAYDRPVLLYAVMHNRALDENRRLQPWLRLWSVLRSR